MKVKLDCMWGFQLNCTLPRILLILFCLQGIFRASSADFSFTTITIIPSSSLPVLSPLQPYATVGAYHNVKPLWPLISRSVSTHFVSSCSRWEPKALPWFESTSHIHGLQAAKPHSNTCLECILTSTNIFTHLWPRNSKFLGCIAPGGGWPLNSNLHLHPRNWHTWSLTGPRMTAIASKDSSLLAASLITLRMPFATPLWLVVIGTFWVHRSLPQHVRLIPVLQFCGRFHWMAGLSDSMWGSARSIRHVQPASLQHHQFTPISLSTHSHFPYPTFVILRALSQPSIFVRGWSHWVEVFKSSDYPLWA